MPEQHRVSGAHITYPNEYLYTIQVPLSLAVAASLGLIVTACAEGADVDESAFTAFQRAHAVAIGGIGGDSSSGVRGSTGGVAGSSSDGVGASQPSIGDAGSNGLGSANGGAPDTDSGGNESGGTGALSESGGSDGGASPGGNGGVPSGGSTNSGGTPNGGNGAGGTTVLGGSSGTECSATSSQSGAVCGSVLSYQGAFYRCIAQGAGINGESAGCGTPGVRCSEITPDHAGWGSSAWQLAEDCP